MARWIGLLWITVFARKLVGLVKRLLTVTVGRLPLVAVASAGRWRRLTAFRRHLLTNLVIGLGIAVVLHHFHQAAYLSQIEDAAVDWAMKMYRGTAPPHGQRPIAFIDIDEDSYRAWDEPLFTPRDKLAKLIRHAIAGSAAAIVVDIDLSRARGPGDEALLALLRDYVADAEPGPSRLPPLILARTARLQAPGTIARLPEERPAFLAPLVERAPRVSWSAPLFDLERDGMVRRWHLWTAVCGTDGRPVVRPSVQLQVKALLTASKDQRAALAAALAALTPHDCEVAPAAAAHQSHDDAAATEVMLGADRLNLRPHETRRRILYTMPWHLNPGESRPTVALDGRLVPAFAVRSAMAISDAAGPVSGEWLRGHLVIIGNSFLDSRDLYDTPIGLMPGPLIIANAIQSLDTRGELRTPGLPETLLIESLLILLMSYLFARLDFFWGSLLASMAVILLLLPLSLWALDLGLWLSFAIPLVAVQIHQLAAQLEAVLARHAIGETSHE